MKITNLRTWAEITVYPPEPLLGRPEERVHLSCIGLRVEGSREEVVSHLLAATEAYREAAERLQHPCNNPAQSQ